MTVERLVNRIQPRVGARPNAGRSPNLIPTRPLDRALDQFDDRLRMAVNGQVAKVITECPQIGLRDFSRCNPDIFTVGFPDKIEIPHRE